MKLRDIAWAGIIVIAVGTLLLFVGRRYAKYDKAYRAAEEYVSHHPKVKMEAGEIRKIGEHYSWNKKDSTATVTISVDGTKANINVTCLLKKEKQVWTVDSLFVGK